MTTIAITAMTYNRGDREYTRRVRGYLASLLDHQTRSPDEVILVDMTPDLNLHLQVYEGVEPYLSNPTFRFISQARDAFSLTLGSNIGIKLAKSEYIAKTDIDLIFSPTFVSALLRRVRKDTLCHTVIKTFSKRDRVLDYPDWKNWMIPLRDQRTEACRGACQCAHRDWWHKVRGYDEAYNGGLHHQDLDLYARAKRDKVHIKWVHWGEAQVFHRWHPRSVLKQGRYSTKHLFGKDTRIIKNDGGWGEMVYESFYEEEE